MRNSLVLGSMMLILASPCMAEITATQNIEIEETFTNPDGTKGNRLVKADVVEPGATLFYSLDFTNNGDDSAENMVLVMEVPPEVTFVEGSISGANSNVTFSADKGQTFVARGRLTVNDTQGSRSATGDDITNIKFSLIEAVSPNQDGEVSFKAILK